MRNKKIIKVVFKITFWLFVILMLLFLLNFSGVLNFYYDKKLKNESELTERLVHKFIDRGIEITGSISNDPILKGAIFQYNLGESILPALKVMNIYKENYKEIKNISIFDYKYNIITSDIESFATVKKVPTAWFLKAQSKNVYVSTIFYNREQNSYNISFLVSIKNAADDILGFCKIDFAIYKILKKFEQMPYLNFLFFDTSEGKINFIYPLDYKFSVPENMINFSFAKNGVYKRKIPGFKNSYIIQIDNTDMAILVVPSNKFYALPIYFIILLSFLLLVTILSYLYLWIDKREQIKRTKNQRIKSIMNEIVTSAQDAEKHSFDLIENLDKDGINEDAVETAKVESNVEDNNEDREEIKKEVKLPDDFKIIE